MEQEPAVQVQDLTKHFGRFVAVDHITFAIPKGVIFGFLGPNGAGKTTTIRMLLGLLRPSQGRATVMGYDVTRETKQMHRVIGYMSQKFSLYDDMTVEENLNFYGRTYGVRGKRLRERKDFILHMAGLENREGELAAHLAGGWKQRLALGTAIIHQPQMLFLDEPTAGVDPISRRAFWELLYTLAGEGTTVFVTTHYMDEAEHCQLLSFIQRGRIAAQGSPMEIKKTVMRGEVIEIDCDRPGEAIARLRDVDGFVEVTLYGALVHVVTPHAGIHIPLIRYTLQEIGISVRTVDVIAPSLEDAFIASLRDEPGAP